MGIFDIIFLAIALSIDASVVSFSNGLIFTQNKRFNSLMLALSVGFFQFFMPVIGFYLAKPLSKYAEPYEHWIVFVIFFILGAKFIKDAFEKEKEQKQVNCYMCFSYIFLVSIATSIDALGAGISIAFSKTQILFPAVIIGIITFLNSLIGFWSGHLFKHFPKRNLEISGGLILIILAFKTLIETF